MSVFRIEKTKDYTVMSNHHLRNKNLSLKAKGLLSQMLSLNDDWDFSLKGLAYINKEGIDAIREAVRELEREGYIVRGRARNSKGQLSGNEYVIYECPQTVQPTLEKPTLENPTLDKPILDNPMLENPTQLNTNISNTDSSITDVSSIESYPISAENDVEHNRELIKENIEYEYLCKNHRKEQVDEIVDILAETVSGTSETVCISGNEYARKFVKDKLLKLRSEHIEYVLDCLKNNSTKIHNIRQYLLASLFNAPSTIDNYYEAEVRHDLNF